MPKSQNVAVVAVSCMMRSRELPWPQTPQPSYEGHVTCSQIEFEISSKDFFPRHPV